MSDHGYSEPIPVNLPADAFDSYGRNGYFRLAEVEVFQASSGEIMVAGYSKRRGDREPARLTLDARAARLLAAALTAIVGAKCATLDCSNLVEADSTSPYCPDCNGLVPDTLSVIRSDTADTLDGEPLYWANDQGWVDRASADTYPDRTGNLPDGGRWEGA